MLKIFIIILIVIFIVLLAVGIIDGNRFEVVNEEFELPNLTKKCRFVMISDLHNKVYGNKNDKVIEAVRTANPDFIIIAGDLITSHVKESTDPGVNLVNALSKDYKVFYGMGNHETRMKQDRGTFGDKFDRLIKGVEHPNVTVLANESCCLDEYNIRMTGLELERMYFAHLRKRKMSENYMEEHVGKVKDNCCNILIAHNPDYFEEYAKWGADFVLSGHVHGGIMRIPFLGGVIAPSYKLFPKYDGGVFYEGKSVMLLGRGMGAHTIPFRFFNPAQLYVVTLIPKGK